MEDTKRIVSFGGGFINNICNLGEDELKYIIMSDGSKKYFKTGRKIVLADMERASRMQKKIEERESKYRIEFERALNNKSRFNTSL